jgi:xanthine/uracil permease
MPKSNARFSPDYKSEFHANCPSAQNNGVIALTRCANRKAGYAACFWLLIMGIFAKFAAALVAIPSAVVASGVRIISTMPFTRRNRFILTASLAVGFGATLVPDWFECVQPQTSLAIRIYTNISTQLRLHLLRL